MNLLVALLINAAAFAQVTTGSIVGFVTSSADGKGLTGASVEAVHEPSGTRYRSNSGADGRYNLPALRIGGPYKVTVSFVGFEKQELTDITVQLGEPTRVDIALIPTTKQLTE